MTAVLARAPPPPPPMGHCSNTVLSVLSKDVTETSSVAVEQWALPKAAHNPWIAVRGCASVAHTLSCAATESSMFALWNGGGASSGSLLRVTGDQIDVEDAPADAIAIVTDSDHSLCVLFRNGDIRALGSMDEIRQSGSEVVITAGTGSMLAYVDTNCQLHLYPNKGVGPVQLERIPPFLNVSPEGYVHYVTFSGEVVNALASAKVQVPKAVMGVASDRRAFACLLPSELHLFDLSTLTPIRRVWVGESHSLGTAMMDGDMCISVLGPLSLAVNTTRADAPPQLLQYRCPETEPATPRVSTTFGDDTIVIDALGVMRIGSFETFEVPVPYQLRRFTIGDVANTTPSLLKTFDDGKVVCSFFDKGLSTIIVGPDVMRLSKVEGLVVDCCWIAPGACRKLVFAGPGVILVASVDTDGMNLCHRIATKAPFFACLSPRDGLVVAVPRVGRITLVEPDGVKETPCQVQDVISASCSPVDGKVRLLSTSGDTYGYISGSVAREGRINGVMTPSTRPCFVQGHPILLSKQDLPVGKTEGIDSGILCGASRQDRVLFALRSDDRTPIPFTV